MNTQAPLANANILRRVVMIVSQAGYRAGFTVDSPVDGSQLLVTCSHRLGVDEKLKIRGRDGDFVPSLRRVQGIPPEIDLAIFHTDAAITPTLPIDFRSSDNIAVSRSVFVAGFPQGEATLGSGEFIPVVHTGTISGFNLDETGRVKELILATHTSGGSSGGPVFMMHPGNSAPQVVAVVSRRLMEWQEVYGPSVGRDDKPVPPASPDEGHLIGYVESPVGLAVATMSRYISDALG